MEYEIASIIQAVLKGLDFLHSRKMIHRDIKAGNILLNHNGEVKIADFGVCAQIMNTYENSKTFIGTLCWMSPEVLNYSEYNKKTDIWSLGITVIEIAEGDPPFSNLKQHMMRNKIIKDPPIGMSDPSKWSKEINDFVAKCLTYNPDNRPDAIELLKHPFIEKYAKGPALLSELVDSCIKEIDEYRLRQNEEDEFGSEEDVQEYKPGDTVDIYDEGNTVVRHAKNSIVFKGKNNEGGQNKANDEPFFMKHIRENGLDYEDEDKARDYAMNFGNDFEDKARFMNKNFNLDKQEDFKAPKDAKEESKAGNFDLGILECKNIEPGQDKLDSRRGPNQDEINSSLQNSRGNREQELVKRSGSLEESSKVDEDMINNQSIYSKKRSNHSKLQSSPNDKLRELAERNYSSSSDSFNCKRDAKQVTEITKDITARNISPPKVS